MQATPLSPNNMSLFRPAIAVLAMLLLVHPAFGHAILLESTPAANAKLTGSNIPIQLRFNVRIDFSRSRLTLVHPDGSPQVLVIKKDSQADIVAADATGLSPGAYRIRWQVLATDGHITRGEVLFTVVGP